MANGRSAAEHFRALGHPTRLDIMQVLVAEGEACVCHLEARLGLRQAYLSQQLARLRQSGLVADRREGLNIYYRPASPAIRKLLEAGARLETALGAAGAVRPPSAASAGALQKPCFCPRCQAARSRGAAGPAAVRARAG
ncbi:MAG TPA: metalloregulator ArsR/SmtB family transcription factor [Anaerolineales bacterium]|nr:metalloregulator ArsR/SmtB family transcription factor [Anaerolineales bacterium]